MKLKELLKVIPEDYDISFAFDINGVCIFVYGNKKDDVILNFATEKKCSKEQVENMDVINLRPCAYVHCWEQNVYEADNIPLSVRPQLLIEIE